MDQRTILIGDVHGCHRELEALLEKLKLVPGEDRVWFVGDLINKGPSSRAVWELYRQSQGQAILGNHELSFLEVASGRPHKHEKYFKKLKKDFGPQFDSFLQDVRSWPLWMEDRDLMMVHAGLIPGKHPDATDPWALTCIRTWDGKGEDLQNESNPPWFDFYEGTKLLVFGHWAALGGLDRPNIIGLDTGCVYGGSLTALVLPERRLVRVKAFETYCAIS